MTVLCSTDAVSYVYFTAKKEENISNMIQYNFDLNIVPSECPITNHN